MQFVLGKTYKLKNTKYGSTFTGRLIDTRKVKYPPPRPSLTGIDHNGQRCHLPVENANNGDRVLCN